MIQLTGITWDHPRGHAPLAASASCYAEDPGIRVEWEKRSLKDFGDAPLEQLARDYDLIVLDHPHMGVAAQAQCLLPLEAWIPADILETLARSSVGPSFSSYHYAGHQWALPVDAACQVSARRADLLADHAIPQDWDAVFRLADELLATDLRLGMALCPTDALCSFLTLCAQFGDAPAPGRRELVSSPIGLSVLNHLRRLAEVCHPASLSWNPIALFDQMARAESDVAYAPLAFGYSNYARPGYAARPLTFGGIPGASHALFGGAGLAISRRCEAPEAAAAYLAWVCSAECQRTLYTRAGGQPGNAAAWTDPRADALAGGFFRQTHDTIKQAYMRPRSASWPAFQEFLGDRIHAFLSREEPPEPVLKELQERYREDLR